MAAMLVESFRATGRTDGREAALTVTVEFPEADGRDWACVVRLDPLWNRPTRIYGLGPLQATQLAISYADTLFRLLVREWIIRDSDGDERTILVASDNDPSP